LTTVLLLGGVPAAQAQGEARQLTLPSEKPLMEGPIHSLGYEQDNGKLGGFTRVDNAQAVPGGNGSWNERRHGKLYRDYIVVTKPGEKGWGALIIPASRIRSLHFSEE
jgi:hypothetical protein